MSEVVREALNRQGLAFDILKSFAPVPGKMKRIERRAVGRVLAAMR